MDELMEGSRGERKGNRKQNKIDAEKGKLKYGQEPCL